MQVRAIVFVLIWTTKCHGEARKKDKRLSTSRWIQDEHLQCYWGCKEAAKLLLPGRNADRNKEAEYSCLNEMSKMNKEAGCRLRLVNMNLWQVPCVTPLFFCSNILLEPYNLGVSEKNAKELWKSTNVRCRTMLGRQVPSIQHLVWCTKDVLPGVS